MAINEQDPDEYKHALVQERDFEREIERYMGENAGRQEAWQRYLRYGFLPGEK